MIEDELKIIQKYYAQLKLKTQREQSLRASHSIDEAEERHELKKDIEQDVVKKVSRKANKKK